MKRTAMFAGGAALAAVGLLAASALSGTAWAEDGQQLYKRYCQSCHGTSGKGDGPASRILKPPPGDLGATLKGMKDQDITKIIREGGRAVGKSAAMPAFSSKLNEEQTKTLVEFVKKFVK
jgi:mono/diheme cytochrome c family protein